MRAQMQKGREVVFDPEHHELIEPPGGAVQSLRDNLQRPDLFQYRNKTWGTFVLASWWRHPSSGRGVLMEILAFDDHMDRLPMASPEEPFLFSNKLPALRALPPVDVIAMQFLAPTEKWRKERLKELADEAAAEQQRFEAHQEQIKEVGKVVAKKFGPHSGDHPDIRRMIEKGEMPE